MGTLTLQDGRGFPRLTQWWGAGLQPAPTLPRDGFQEAWGILYRGYLSTVFPGGGGVASPTS